MKKRRIIAAVLSAVVASTGLTACGASAPGLSASSLPAPSGVVSPPGVRKGVPQDITAMVLPATGVDTRLTRGLDGFAQAVGHARLRECVQRQGVGLPEVAPPAYIGWSDLPDLEFIGRHGLTLNVPVLPEAEAEAKAEAKAEAADSPDPVGRNDPAAQRRCGQDAQNVTREFKDLYSPLQSQWWPEVSAVRDDPRIREALRGLPGCLERYGIRVDDQNGFFALVDRTVQGIEDADEAARADRGLGAAYSTCMAPVEAAREPLLVKRRTAFQASHRDELLALRRTLLPRIRELERRYGLSFAHPVP
ncbi:hypothetical protein ACFQ7J_10500 [Streptomyces sp. NPDC056501]|uniref:hypothetical protein n=1 Tax=Streptomyces sp. NPDC056501 TaxID=3345841 RepID=UPI00369A899B